MTKLEKWIVGIIVSCMVFIIGSFAYVSNIVEEQRGAKQSNIPITKFISSSFTSKPANLPSISNTFSTNKDTPRTLIMLFQLNFISLPTVNLFIQFFNIIILNN